MCIVYYVGYASTEIMSFGCRFIEMLKRIGYADANTLNPASFDWMIEDKELEPFLETLCQDITEEHVITPQERKEYDALQADMSSLMNENVSEDELQEGIADLEVEAAHSEKCLRLLERQKNLLSMHKLGLCRGEGELEKVLRDYQKEFQELKADAVPEAGADVVAAVDSGVDLVNGFHTFIEEPPDSDEVPPRNALFLTNLKQYLETEELVLQNVTKFLHDFQKFVDEAESKTVDESFIDHISQLSVDEQEKKLVFDSLDLKSRAQKTEENYVKAALEVTKLTSQIHFYRNLMEKQSLSVYDLTDAELKSRLNTAEKILQQQQNEERELLGDVNKAISDSLHLQAEKVAALCFKEKGKRYERYYETFQKSLDIMYELKARLEFLTIALSIEESGVTDIIDKIQTLRKEIETEADEIRKHKSQCNENIDEPKSEHCVSEGSLLYAINEIISMGSDEELAYLTENDVHRKAGHLKTTESKLLEESEELLQEQLNWIGIAEKNMNMFEDHIHGKSVKSMENPTNLIEELNSKLNKLGIRIQDVEGKLLEKMTEYQKKKKLIEQNSSLEKSRKLFVYALTNQERFLHCIEEIKAMHSKWLKTTDTASN